MTDKRPICRIPPDAKVGDVVVCRNGDKRIIQGRYVNFLGIAVEGWSPGGYNPDGTNWHGRNREWDCIAFEYADGRKPNLPHTEKPKRTQAQRDAKFIRSRAVSWWHRAMTNAEYDRMLAIADRLEKQQ